MGQSSCNNLLVARALPAEPGRGSVLLDFHLPPFLSHQTYRSSCILKIANFSPFCANSRSVSPADKRRIAESADTYKSYAPPRDRTVELGTTRMPSHSSAASGSPRSALKRKIGLTMIVITSSPRPFPWSFRLRRTACRLYRH